MRANADDVGNPVSIRTFTLATLEQTAARSKVDGDLATPFARVYVCVCVRGSFPKPELIQSP